MPNDPAASVIVPTHQRRESVEGCLRSLLAQDLPPDEFEIILVDDGSTDGTADRMEAVAREACRAVTVIRQDRRGPGAARNAGAAAAKGTVFAFIDSDTLAHHSWLREGLVPFGEDGVVGVEGRTLIPEGEGGGPFARRTQNPFGRRFMGCNLLFRREAFEAVGGFDEAFGRIPFREDTDLAHRVLKEGGRIAFAPAALVSHPPGDGTWRTPLYLAWRYRNDPLLFRKDWRSYLTRVDVYPLGQVTIWKPRLVLYGLYLVSLPALIFAGATWAGGAAAVTLSGILLLHLHRCAPKDAPPHQLLLLFPVCALVPFVFSAAIFVGTLRLLFGGRAGHPRRERKITARMP